MGGGGVVVAVATFAIWFLGSSEALGFKCSSESATCQALIDYKSPNATSYGAIQTLFNITNFIDLVGANARPRTTLPTASVDKDQIVRIPFPCNCTNSIGLSNHLPRYIVKDGDTLSHIAQDVFSGLVTYPQIQQANNIPDANKILVGQDFWIPLPCSCEQVNSTTKVVHYGRIVAAGSSVQQLAQQSGIAQDILLDLNNMTDPNALLAGQIFDVPLRACSLGVRSGSLDSSSLVANGTDLYTANGCVKCSCDSSNDWTAQCEASGSNSTCPSMQCQSSGSNSTQLTIGSSNTTSSCPRATCVYDGYSATANANGTIFTNLVTNSTCPASGASRISFHGSPSNLVLIVIHLVLLSLYLCF
ncbi:hypothetical protein L6164_004700 [Bauhinia variegata]|uniref:Uncharacterized protein n=1 Tax=Bauhinia variegata TaxID=167791 RepID=A0ACB9PNW7_BAUVA|nr:hypothetical protein L6164_004700 [Bauhinia variegata]